MYIDKTYVEMPQNYELYTMKNQIVHLVYKLPTEANYCDRKSYFNICFRIWGLWKLNNDWKCLPDFHYKIASSKEKSTPLYMMFGESERKPLCMENQQNFLVSCTQFYLFNLCKMLTVNQKIRCWILIFQTGNTYIWTSREKEKTNDLKLKIKKIKKYREDLYI